MKINQIKSNQMEYENVEQEMDSLKYVIDKLFNINVMKNSRTRNVIDARLIYAKILRDRGHTLTSIARSLHKDHTTIIHYISQVDHLLRHDVRLAEKYIACKELFLRDKPFLSENLKESDVVSRLIKLTSDYEKLILERKNVLSMRDKYKRIEGIVDLVDSRTPNGSEKIIEEKINKMFNGFYQKE
jgi:hypothetical protein